MGGRKPPQYYAGENVRFDISIAQSGRSAFGQIEPKRRKSGFFGLAVAELSVAGLARGQAATSLTSSVMIEATRTVAVLVPSLARSLVFEATSRTRRAFVFETVFVNWDRSGDALHRLVSDRQNPLLAIVERLCDVDGAREPEPTGVSRGCDASTRQPRR